MPQAINLTAEQEIRFAVVLYGGASLAIYINGVAQELFRMVRSTALGRDDLKGTERIYRKIGLLLAPGREPGTLAPLDDDHGSPKARFVVDIVSGTSAGGINGVALAKSLALQCPDMNALQNTWLKRAQIEDLLNDKGDPQTSLLDSAYMYKIILDTLHKVSDSAGTGEAAFADQIDLFVTATDLNGLWEPLQLADGAIDERVHKAVFQFSYATAEFAGAAGPVNDFTRENDPMLAFAARCTSSFPIAFEPMKFDDIKPAIGGTETDLNLAKSTFGRFFERYQDRGEGFTGARTLALGARLFADGGYLDNRPFSYAIDLIQYRTSTTPVKRKLLFVDPFPEYANSQEPSKTIDFLENAQLALTTLPRYETIRGDIDRINENNRRQNRLAALRDELDAAAEPTDDRRSGVGPDAVSDDAFRKTPIDVLIDEFDYGRCYRAYHALRKQTATADLAAALAKRLGYRGAGDEAYFIHLILRAWREANYADTLKPTVELGNAFLLDFDLEYERRRVNDLIALIDKGVSGKADSKDRALLSEIEPLVLVELRAALRTQLRTLSDAGHAAIAQSYKSVSSVVADMGAAFHQIMRELDRHRRYEFAAQAYRENRATIDAAMALIKGVYAPRLGNARRDTTALLENTQFAPLAARYRKFQWRDAVALPFLDGTDSKEHTQIEVYRVGPADSALYPNALAGRPERKLAGTALAAFGAFLQESWRQNDIMWGRLDGAERIISALLPNEPDAALRLQLIDAAQDEILSETLGAAADNDLLFKWLVHRLTQETDRRKTPDEILGLAREFFPKSAAIIGPGKFVAFVKQYYAVPPPPSPQRMIGWASKALKIFSRMVDDLDRTEESGVGRGITKRLSRWLQLAGSLLTQVLAFAVPEAVGYHLLWRWLPTIALAGLLLVAVGAVFGVASVAGIGYAAIGGCLVIWLAQQAFVRFVLRRKRRLRLVAAILVGLGVAVMFGAIPWIMGMQALYQYLKLVPWPRL